MFVFATSILYIIMFKNWDLFWVDKGQRGLVILKSTLHTFQIFRLQIGLIFFAYSKSHRTEIVKNITIAISMAVTQFATGKLSYCHGKS